jgi:hypothetical protein
VRVARNGQHRTAKGLTLVTADRRWAAVARTTQEARCLIAQPAADHGSCTAQWQPRVKRVSRLSQWTPG